MLSLKSQKVESHSRVMEMQSTIASLRDELKTLEMAFEEKENEIKMLQQRETDSIKENDREVTALKETLKKKEAELEDLKYHLESPVNVWSVSADDPSNPTVNITARESKTEAREGKEQDEHLHEAGRDEMVDGVGVDLQKETTGETKFQKLENAQDDVKDGSTNGEKSISAGEGNENKDSQYELDRGNTGEKDNPNATDAISTSEVGRTVEESNIKVTDKKEYDITRNGLPEKLENSQGGAGQKLGAIFKGVKMEMPGRPSSITGRNHGYAGKTKEKRWKILTRSRGFENNGNSGNIRAATTGRRRFSKRAKFPTTDTSLQVGQKYETGVEYGSSEVGNHVPDVVIPNSRVSSKAGDITNIAGELQKEVGEDRERKAADIQQETGTMNFHEAEEHDEHAKVTEVDEEPEDPDFEDSHLQEKEAADGASFRNEFEDNTEGYKDETDEPEF